MTPLTSNPIIKYNYLTAIKFHHNNKFRAAYWLFECDCGNTKIIRMSEVKSGKIKSCGCLHKKIVCTHKLSNTPVYNSWSGMKQRCSNKNSKDFKRYGGRGIKLCKRWMTFENFYEDMGDRPKGKTLDRIDNNKGYNKTNCKWATNKEQMNNQAKNIHVSVNGVKISLHDLADMFSIKYDLLRQRLFRDNWSLGKALNKN